MKTTPTKRSLERFGYFSECEDVLRLPAIEYAPDGHTAAECFHARETYGKDLPCCEPDLLSRALNGKEQHGITVTMVAEDYVDRIIFAKEIHDNYPAWVQGDIFGRAKQIAKDRLGWIPTFVAASADFTNKEL